VVSDDPGLRDFLEEGLVLGGFWVSQVGSAIQTMEVFRLRTFDLMLLDATLGGLGALELLRRLRGRTDRAAGDLPRTDVPIWLIAASGEEIEPDAAVAAGADGIMLAPLDLEELVPRLFQVVADWRTRHPDRPWADQTNA
jgi:two-component system KDP operon response regulator KdpE